jgi:hypothetical protein
MQDHNQNNPEGTKKIPLNVPTQSAEEIETEKWLAIRKEAGRKIDPETAEVQCMYAFTGNPYGLPQLPAWTEMEKEYYAKDPGSDIFVWFGDLPVATANTLWEKHKARLAAEEIEAEKWLAVRKEAGRKIDPETAEVDWSYAEGGNPYGAHPPEVCSSQVGREYFARDLGSDIWVWFGDLPVATQDALWAKRRAVQITRVAIRELDQWCQKYKPCPEFGESIQLIEKWKQRTGIGELIQLIEERIENLRSR